MILSNIIRCIRYRKNASNDIFRKANNKNIQFIYIVKDFLIEYEGIFE